MRIEIFTAPGCPSCEGAVRAAVAAAEGLDEPIELRVINVLEVLERAVRLGVRATPAIAVDGELVLTGMPSVPAMRTLLEARLHGRPRAEVDGSEGDDGLSDR
ncbi:MAG: glutaredoxin [Gammaproteobacteria bacterium]|nr:glutaredoxin [Gemmatimonadota bacterium]NIR82447.1 glutaredoxin [Gammaproteobacteria bacterium]NIU03583.1 glutaredoxin [Gammaproteobacteria bacterium]NIX84857.1 glutaredoxin [Gammaproteobacteria bacterium]